MSEFVNPDDLSVQRDGEGHLIPEVKEAGNFGKVKVLPMTYGDVQSRFGDGTEFDFDSEDLAEIFDEHVVKPNLSEVAGGEVTAGYVEGMYPLAPRDLLMSILEASGVDADVEAQQGGGASVSVGGN